VAVVTSIGLDHCDWLGDTREAIGREKAGIARAGRPLLYGERDMPASIAEVCHEQGAQLKRAGEAFGFEAETGRLFWQAQSLRLTDAVWLGEDNLATALQALAEVGVTPSTAVIRDVAASTRLRGRCEQHRLDGCDWLFDVGHNREAMARVAARLPSHGGRTLALCGMLADKPAEAVLALAPRVNQWFVTDLPGPRGGGVERFASLLPDALRFAQLQDALAALRAELVAGDRVLVTGSFVTVMQAQALLGLAQDNGQEVN
jgi:dihydrofolate synthase/folylpolyglutamate synthase